MDSQPFKRPTSEYMESILGYKFPVLDHGFVCVVDFMGDWRTVANCARQSFQGEEKAKTEVEDAALIRRLLRDNHTSPFESCEIRIQMALPIFVARQVIRHRTSSVNEWSARYSKLPDLTYLPKLERIQVQSKINKQGSGESMDLQSQQEILERIILSNSESYENYEALLQTGLTRELARSVLNLNTYTCWSWKMDLHNLLHFCSLRADPHAQYEVRVYAEKIEEIIKNWLPPIYQAYLDYKKNAIKLSSVEKEALIKNIDLGLLNKIIIDFENIPNVTKNEVEAFKAKLIGLKSIA